MISEESYRYLVEDAYRVDSKKVKIPLKRSDIVGNSDYVIIEPPIDNTSNGMQAMVVAYLTLSIVLRMKKLKQ